MANRKDMGEAGHPHGMEDRVDIGERVLYLFYLRLVLLAHQLVRGVASGRRWAEHNEAGRGRRGFSPALVCYSATAFAIGNGGNRKLEMRSSSPCVRTLPAAHE